MAQPLFWFTILLTYVTSTVYCYLFGTIFKDCVVPPQECPNSNITFWFYTQETKDNPKQLNAFEPKSLTDINFIPSAPFKIIIHGYTGHRDYSPNTEIRPALFEKGQFNVISVDYGILAKPPCYFQAILNLPMIGNCTAQLIDMLVERARVPFDDIHVIGFSLGAQTAGYLSKFLKSGKLTRITGLDPAMPGFSTGLVGARLDYNHAQFVDVIHTNSLNKGKLEATGHVDFYVNGGLSQPGCDGPQVENSDSCSHARAPAYYGESINSKVGFWGKKCAGWLAYISGKCNLDNATQMIMGEYTPFTARGQYFVTTKDKFPFAVGNFSIHNISDILDKIESKNSVQPD